jgi:hypothetical protein
MVCMCSRPNPIDILRITRKLLNINELLPVFWARSRYSHPPKVCFRWALSPTTGASRAYLARGEVSRLRLAGHRP